MKTETTDVQAVGTEKMFSGCSRIHDTDGMFSGVTVLNKCPEIPDLGVLTEITEYFRVVKEFKEAC